jgi:MacB-like periplasmic core domain
MLARWRSFWRALGRRSSFEREMDEELQSHMENRIEHYLRGGLPRKEAVRRARIEFGSVQAYKDQCREARGIHLIDDLRMDLRFAIRGLRKNWLLSGAVILTLTLGIGINTGVFTLINAIVFRPRVDHDPDSFLRLIPAYSAGERSGPLGIRGAATLPDYLALRGARSLRELAAWYDTRERLGENPAPVRALMASCNFFSVFTLDRPRLGRVLQEEDCSTGRAVIVISSELWQSRFAADPQIVGKVVHAGGIPVTIIGVTPSPFAGRWNNADTWFPYTLQPRLHPEINLLEARDTPWLVLAGRLRHGFTRGDPR